MKFEIKSWLNSGLLFRIETESWKLAVEAAVKQGVNLSSANLRYADLRYADLRYANLRYADLRYADLRYANLSSADLSYADLSSAEGIKDYLSIGPIGSRRDYLFVSKNDKGELIVMAGCWFGSLEDFKKRVKEVHGKNKHGQDYGFVIKLIESRFKEIEKMGGGK